MTWAMLVPRKGTEFPWIAKRAARFVDQLGHNRVTLRCDNEPAIEAMAMEIGQARQEGSQTVPERPPVGESQSNGVTERAVGLVAGQVRTLEAALEHRAGTRIPPDARILCWLVEFAAYLMNRCDGGSDGKTPLQRLHGRRDNTPILEFGEKTWYMLAKPARRGKWEPRFHPGVFVGMLNSSSEAVVVTEQGTVIKTRSANLVSSVRLYFHLCLRTMTRRCVPLGSPAKMRFCLSVRTLPPCGTNCVSLQLERSCKPLLNET